MNHNRPLVSVIVAAFDAGRYIGEALDSIFAQSYPALDVIVIDDGSTDNTAEIAQGYDQVWYIYQDSAGGPAAKNTGFQAAKGDYFALLDSDDVWMPEKIALQMAAFQQDPGLDIVFTHIEQFLSKEADSTKHHIPDELEVIPGYISSTMMVRRDSFWKVGLLDTSLTLGDFIDWYMRAKEQGLKDTVLDQTLARRRIHDANTGIVHRDARKDYLRALRGSLSRRRAQND